MKLLRHAISNERHGIHVIQLQIDYYFSSINIKSKYCIEFDIRWFHYIWYLNEISYSQKTIHTYIYISRYIPVCIYIYICTHIYLHVYACVCFIWNYINVQWFGILVKEMMLGRPCKQRLLYIYVYPNPCFVLYIRSVASMTNNSQCKGFFFEVIL